MLEQSAEQELLHYSESFDWGLFIFYGGKGGGGGVCWDLEECHLQIV